MRILLACNPDSSPFTESLATAVSRQPLVRSVESSTAAFWQIRTQADLVHLHWPEALFGWREPTKHGLMTARAMLAYWKSRATIVATIHNSHPHQRDTAAFRELYRLVYGHADGIVHRGKASLDFFRDRYPDLDDKQHTVIPLGALTFKNHVTSRDARQYLKLPEEAFVSLAFGALRDASETTFLLRGFAALPRHDKHLVIAGRVSISPKRHVRALRRLQWRLDPRLHVTEGFIPDDLVQYYLNAANTLVIPRLVVMNSANLPLGFTFRKVVTGPDVGVVGEILRKTGNPVFTPGDHQSLAMALEEARELDLLGIGEANRRYADAHWDWGSIGREHVAFYHQLREAGARRSASAMPHRRLPDGNSTRLQNAQPSSTNSGD